MNIRSFAIALVLIFVTQFAIACVSPSNADIEKRVDSILGKMTMDEKLEIIGGINDFLLDRTRASEFRR